MRYSVAKEHKYIEEAIFKNQWKTQHDKCLTETLKNVTAKKAQVDSKL